MPASFFIAISVTAYITGVQVYPLTPATAIGIFISE